MNRWVVLIIAAIGIFITASPLLIPLFATIVIELLVVICSAKYFKLNMESAAFASLLINIITQPVLYAAIPILPLADGQYWWIAMIFAEIAVWIVEALLYFYVLNLPRSRQSLAKIARLSFVANITSMIIGLLMPF